LKDGKPNGFKLYAIRPGSIFARLGLQNADLIKTINGLEISTPDKALEAYARLRNSPELSLALERHGQDVTLNVQIR
jgi:general secretion pathway protein C